MDSFGSDVKAVLSDRRVMAVLAIQMAWPLVYLFFIRH
jgi:hypothetical protein